MPGLSMVALGFALFLAPTALAQDVSVAASVDETTIGTEETLRLTVQVTGASFNDVPNPSPPETSGLGLVQPTPSTQQSVSFVNGQYSQSLSFVWRYRPSAEGTARIGPVTVKIKGTDYATEAIRIKVIPQAQRPTRPNRPRRGLLDDLVSPATEPTPAREITNKDIFIRARPTARRAFKNQQVKIDYDLYFRQGFTLRNSRLADSWDAEGFWREDLELSDQTPVKDEIVDGLRYRVATLKRVVVFPTRTGDLEVDPLKIEMDVAMPSRRRSFDTIFRFDPTRTQEVTVVSPPVKIVSRDLPRGAPTDFGGAVGKFTLKADVDRADVEAGEVITFDVTVAGSGNVATLPVPELQLPPLIEKYEPQIRDRITRTRNRLSGSKTFSYALIPRSAGEHIIPPVKFSFFDPASERFTTLETKPIKISVTGEMVAPSEIRRNVSGFPMDDIAGAFTGINEWKPRNAVPLHRQTFPLGAFLLPLVGLLFLFGYRKRREKYQTDVKFARNRRAHPAARKHLKKASALLSQNQPADFYEEIAQALYGYIGNKLNVATLGMTIHDLKTCLRSNGATQNTADNLGELLAECDRARFAPIPPGRDAMETATDRAAEIIATLHDVFSGKA